MLFQANFLNGIVLAFDAEILHPAFDVVCAPRAGAGAAAVVVFPKPSGSRPNGDGRFDGFVEILVGAILAMVGEDDDISLQFVRADFEEAIAAFDTQVSCYQHLLAADGDVEDDGCVIDGIASLYFIWIVEDFHFDTIDFEDVARFGDLLRDIRCFQRRDGGHGFLEAAFFTLVCFLNPFLADEIIA